MDWVHKNNWVSFFNDHPMPQADQLSQEEIDFRWEGLTSIMDKGLDFWWYDSNWGDIIPGIIKNWKGGDSVDNKSWGQYLFKSIQERYNKENGRNVREISLGRDTGVHPANHRYPVQWTGDIHTNTLMQQVSLEVNNGVETLRPYVHPDCAGHYGPTTAKEYVRWM